MGLHSNCLKFCLIFFCSFFFLFYTYFRDCVLDFICQLFFHALESRTLDLNNFRGQSYDNAANMASSYSGLQTLFKNNYPLAHLIPCSAHSLNLIRECAIFSFKDAVNFFVYFKFFSLSTHR